MNDAETKILNETHDKLLEEWRSGNSVKPLFFYALDKNYFSDEAYQIVHNRIEEIASWKPSRETSNQIQLKALALILYHIRVFFERGNGVNIWDCLEKEGAKSARHSVFGNILGLGSNGSETEKTKNKTKKSEFIKEIVSPYEDFLFNDTILKELGTHDEQLKSQSEDYREWFRYNCPFIAADDTGDASSRIKINNEVAYSECLSTYISAISWPEVIAAYHGKTLDSLCVRATNEYITENQDDETIDDGRLNKLGFSYSYIHALLKHAPVEYLIGLKSLVSDSEDVKQNELVLSIWPWAAALWGKGERNYSYWALKESPTHKKCYLSLYSVKSGFAPARYGLSSLDNNEIWRSSIFNQKVEEKLNPEGSIFRRIWRKDCRIVNNKEYLPRSLYVLSKRDSVVSVFDDENNLSLKVEKIELVRSAKDTEKLKDYCVFKVNMRSLFSLPVEVKEVNVRVLINNKEHLYQFYRNFNIHLDEDAKNVLGGVKCLQYADCDIIQGNEIPLDSIINGEGVENNDLLTFLPGKYVLQLNNKDYFGKPVTLKNSTNSYRRVIFLPDDWRKYAVDDTKVMQKGRQAYRIPLSGKSYLELEGELEYPVACWDGTESMTVDNFADLMKMHLLQSFPQDKEPESFVRIFIDGIEAIKLPPDEKRTIAEYIICEHNDKAYPGCKLDVEYRQPSGKVCKLFSGNFVTEGLDYLYSKNNILRSDSVDPNIKISIAPCVHPITGEEEYCRWRNGEFILFLKDTPLWLECTVDARGFKHSAKGWLLPDNFPYETQLSKLAPADTEALERLLHPLRFSKDESFEVLVSQPNPAIDIVLEHESGRLEIISAATDIAYVRDVATQDYKASITEAMSILELPMGWYRLSLDNEQESVFAFHLFAPNGSWYTPDSKETKKSANWSPLYSMFPSYVCDMENVLSELLRIIFLKGNTAAAQETFANLPLNGLFHVTGIRPTMPIFAVCYSSGKFYLKDRETCDRVALGGITQAPRGKYWARHSQPDGNLQSVANLPNVSEVSQALLSLLPQNIHSSSCQFVCSEIILAKHLISYFSNIDAARVVLGIVKAWYRDGKIVAARMLLYFTLAYEYQEAEEGRRKRIRRNLEKTHSAASYLSFLSSVKQEPWYNEVALELKNFISWFFAWFKNV